MTIEMLVILLLILWLAGGLVFPAVAGLANILLFVVLLLIILRLARRV